MGYLGRWLSTDEMRDNNAKIGLPQHDVKESLHSQLLLGPNCEESSIKLA